MRLFAALLFFVAAAAEAAVGLTELSGMDGDNPVTVFYPTAAAPQPLKRGPFTVNVAFNATPTRGNGRLVVLSHGSGGSAWTYSDLARTLVDAGFVVTIPLHRGDNFADHSEIGPPTWRRRPAEVSRAIDAVGRDSRFAPLLQIDKVGMYGMSAGGHTALSLAGGRWSPAGLKRHCEVHIAEDFPACVGLSRQLRGNMFDGFKIWTSLFIIGQKFGDATWVTYNDPRVRAIVAGVPYAADFDMTSLAKPRVPLGIVNMGGDKWLAPRFHGEAVLKACASCTAVANLPNGGHGALLSPLPPNLPDAAAELLNDPPGFDRSLLPEIDRKIAAFFQKHLLP